MKKSSSDGSLEKSLFQSIIYNKNCEIKNIINDQNISDSTKIKKLIALSKKINKDFRIDDIDKSMLSNEINANINKILGEYEEVSRKRFRDSYGSDENKNSKEESEENSYNNF